MRKLIAVLLFCGLAFAANAQTSPNIQNRQTPTAAQWNSYFQAKQDALNYTPLNSAGGTLTGRLVIAPGSFIDAPFRITPGSAPVAPGNGDVWVTNSGMFARVNGINVLLGDTNAITTVALTAPSFMTVIGSPLTGSGGTLALGMTFQPANRFMAGPASGADALPGFRSMVQKDVPTNTLSGTGAVAYSPYTFFQRNLVTPETFGAACDGNDAGPGIQAAINYLGSTSGGSVLLAPCLYTLNTPLTIPGTGVSVIGTQFNTGNGTELYFVPSAAGQCAVSIGAGASIAYGHNIERVAFRSPDTTTYKTAICVSDASVTTFRDVYVWSWSGGHASSVTGAVASPSGEIRLTVTDAGVNYSTGWAVAVAGVVGTTEANSGWPITVVDGSHIDLKGSTFANAYVSGGTIKLLSTGLQTKGRDFYTSAGLFLTADLPMRVSVDPNLATYALDQSNFGNLQLQAPLPGSSVAVAGAATSCSLMIDDGVAMTNVKWSGTQAWIGGKSGVCFRDKSSIAVSEVVSFDNFRDEQPAATGGYIIDWQPHSTTYSLHISNGLFAAVTNGIRARNVANLQIDNPHFLNGVGQTCLDLDSTVQSTSINGAYAIAGTTNNLSGQTLRSSAPNVTGGCVSPSAEYANTSSGNETLFSPLITGGVATFGVAGSAAAVLNLKNGTSGQILLHPDTGALGSSDATLKAGTYNLVGDSLTQTLSGKTIDCSSGNTCTYAVAGATDYGALPWTPAFTTDGTVGTPSYVANGQVGSYEHVGNEWRVRFYVALSGWTGSPTGNVLISGLPHANNATTHDWGQCFITGWSSGSALNFVSGVIKEGSSSINLFQSAGAATGLGNLTQSQLSATGLINGSCTYHE